MAHYSKRKIVNFELQYLQTARCTKYKFGENAFGAFSNISVHSEKLNLNALISLVLVFRCVRDQVTQL